MEGMSSSGGLEIGISCFTGPHFGTGGQKHTHTYYCRIFCCDIPWYSTIVTVILRFFVMTAYTFATSPGHLSQLLFRPLAPSFVVLSLSTGNLWQLATCAAIEFICPIHRNPLPSSVRFIEFIPADFSSTSGTLILLSLSLFSH
jgi:hypothetical protein